jgi:hypothetical protein
VEWPVLDYGAVEGVGLVAETVAVEKRKVFVEVIVPIADAVPLARLELR